MKVHVIETETSKIDWEYSCWIHEMKKKHYSVKLESITPHTYEDKKENKSMSSLLIIYETYAIGE